MTKATFVLSASLAICGVTGVAGALLAPSVAMAQQKVGATVGKHLKTAQEAIQKKRWDAALGAIKQAQAVDTKTPFEQYKINELLWYVYLQQGRNADAARLLEQQIASGQMPAGKYEVVGELRAQHQQFVPGSRQAAQQFHKFRFAESGAGVAAEHLERAFIHDKHG